MALPCLSYLPIQRERKEKSTNVFEVFMEIVPPLSSFWSSKSSDGLSRR